MKFRIQCKCKQDPDRNCSHSFDIILILSVVEGKIYIPQFILSRNHVYSSKDTKMYSSLHRENITEIGYDIFTEMVVKIRLEKGAKGD